MFAPASAYMGLPCQGVEVARSLLRVARWMSLGHRGRGSPLLGREGLWKTVAAETPSESHQ